jgi:hypothetical protein
MSVTSLIGIPLAQAMNPDGSRLALNSSSSGFSISSPSRGSLVLQSMPASINVPVRNSVVLEAIVPPDYDTGANNLTALIDVSMISPGPNRTISQSVLTGGTATLSVYQQTESGVPNLLPGATDQLPQVSAGATQLSFSLDGSTINPGDRLLLVLSVNFNETAPMANTRCQINLASLQCVTG